MRSLKKTCGKQSKLSSTIATRVKRIFSRLDLEAAEFSIVKYENALELANKRKDVLLGPTKRRMEIQYDANIKAAAVRLENDKESLQIELQELAEYQEMVDKCTIVCPDGVSGQVVHANITSRSRNWVLEEGAFVYERQVMINIPDMSDLEILATIDESQVTTVQIGMPVIVTFDALHSATEVRGEVIRVNSYPEPDSWGSGGVKKYGVGVKLFDPPEALRPGMNALIDIQTVYQEDALQVANQCLYDHREGFSDWPRMVKAIAQSNSISNRPTSNGLGLPRIPMKELSRGSSWS